MQPTSVGGGGCLKFNSLVEANNRESETMDTIALFADAVASD